jgi:hypothetical protein
MDIGWMGWGLIGLEILMTAVLVIPLFRESDPEPDPIDPDIFS